MIQTQSKLELSVELMANAFESDKEGREAFKSILAVTIQDEFDRHTVDTAWTVRLTDSDIVRISAQAAEDFVLTIENQKD